MGGLSQTEGERSAFATSAIGGGISSATACDDNNNKSESHNEDMDNDVGGNMWNLSQE